MASMAKRCGQPERRRFASLLLLGALVAGTACSQARAPVSTGDDEADADPVVDAGKPAKPKPVDACPASNPYCKRDAAPPPPSCATVPVDLTPAGVNVMIAVEGAASMQKHWPIVQTAVKKLRANHPNSAFGLQVFYGELANVESGMAKSNWCGETQNKVLDVSDDNTEKKLLDFLGDAPPGESYVGGLFQTSPVIEPLNYYLKNATKLADPKRTNYLVFITNGNDNCFGSLFAAKTLKQAAYEKLAIELGKRNIRIVPIGFDANSGPDNTGITNATINHTDVDTLQWLLDLGGSGLKKVPKADDPSKLAEVIDQVGQAVRNCRFVIPDALDPTKGVNPFALDFTVSGALVKRDRLDKEGWNFVSGNSSQVELYGQACEAVRAGQPLVAQKTCSDNVCGTASVKVETKPRSVLFLLDASASVTASM